MKLVKVDFCTTLLLLLAITVAADDCNYGTYDFSPLKNTLWDVRNDTGSEKTTFHISICGPLTDRTDACSQDTSVCKIRDGGTDGDKASVVGSYASTLNITEDSTKGELMLYLQGAECPDIEKAKWASVIYFKCGTTLGSPALLSSHACTTYFEWYTSVACKDATPTKEVKCYLYDDNNNKFDLSPLIKTSGAYLTQSSNSDSDFYINICREITSGTGDDPTTACTTGSAACGVASEVTINGGIPSSDLEMSSGGHLQLTYKSDTKPDGCTDNPVTTVTFICPDRKNGQHHGGLPMLTSDLSCHYEVEWTTEYACRESYTVTNDCSFTLDRHDVQVDLRPLTAPGFPYNVTSKKGEETYIYYLNVCGALSIDCLNTGDNTGITSCQNKQDDALFGKSLGQLSTQKLRYSDGELSLTYNGGTTCHTNIQRSTVVNFHCKEGAGKGMPTFSSEDSCTYIFNWETQYACLSEEPPAAQCSLTAGKNRFDLTSLIRESGSEGVNDNWQALDNQNVEGTTASKIYFINICHEVLRTGEAEGCATGAGVCVKDPQGSFKNLGQSKSTPPSTDAGADTAILRYTDGDVCAFDQSKKYESVIYLRCKPGDLETGPVLSGISSNKCVYEFTWWTMVGCPLAKKTGTDCKVYDDTAGYSFDLSPLTKPSGTNYQVSSPDHDYYINVCDAVTDTKCNEGDHAAKRAGVCQVDPNNDDQVHNTGQPNSNLTYYDGMITLTYLNGDPYASKELRKTEITFLCDPGATGEGTLEFQDEAEHTYSFRWFTALACPEQPIECLVFDEENNKQYDLSSLSHTSVEDNWSTEDDSNSQEKRKFYINVCRPLAPVHVEEGCSSFAGVCNTIFTDGQEHIGTSNLGKALSKPLLDGDKIILEYTDGEKCTDGQKYSTKIHLQCKKGALTEPPRFLDQGGTDNCEYSFMWETEAACPLEDVKGTDDCTVTDPNSEYAYNLQPLKKKDGFYEVKDPNSDKTYKLNICDAVSDCPQLDGKEPTAVCEGGVSLGAVNSKLDLSDGILSLTYSGPRQNQVRAKTIITFICDKSVPIGQPIYRQDPVTDGVNHLFDFPTSLACPPDPVDCRVTDDEGNEYDLTPLAKETDNWRVVDTRPDHGDLKYYINVCRPLNTIPGTSCHGGPVGSCQVSSDGKSFNGGYIRSKPHAAEGAVTLQYYGGDKCHQNTENESYRSTRINFECSSVEHGPVFETESAECEYLFTWMTPAACSMKKVTGQDCKVEDPLYHETFDLGDLTKGGDANWEVSTDDGEYSFLLNVCAPLNDAPGQCQGADVGACQTKPGDATFSQAAGKFNKKVIYEDGTLMLVYSEGNGNCHGKYNRTTIINFICDHYPGDHAGPRYIKEDFDCTYMFEWPTASACMPFKPGQCTTVDTNGNSYDLTSLTLLDSNYEIEQFNPHLKFVINVCTVLVHSKGVTCPPNAAACMIDMTDDSQKKFSSLGEPSAHQLTLDNTGSGTNLKLTYENGNDCANGKKSKTIISLTCKEGALDTRPEYEYQEDNCEYTFTWETQAACPLSVDVPPVTSDCTAKNPATGYEFNLNSLKKADGYTVADITDHTFLINVCEPLPDTEGDCGANSGSCQKEVNGDRQWNAGNANSNLQYLDGILQLNYTDGQKCHHNDLARNTVISFVCGASDTGNGEPVFIGETDDCTYYISWHTELACEEHVRCQVEYKGQVVDLSPLTKTTGYHLATYTTEDTDDDTTYYINVCRPLNPVQGVLCPPGASACLKSGQDSPVSLGRVDEAPKVDSDMDKIIIEYNHGTQCAGGSGTRSSKIIFICEAGLSEGTPSLVSVSQNDCEYTFEWKTNVVCPESAPVTEQHNCTFTDSRTQYTYDFSSLTVTSGSNYKVTKDTYRYWLNVCSAVKDDTIGCDGAAICRVEDNTALSMGAPDKVTFFMEGDRVKMTYLNGGACAGSSNGLASAAILFECDRGVVGKGEPEYFTASDCTAVFKWRTPFACTPVIETCVFTHSGSTYDLSLLSKVKDSWQFSEDGVSYWMNICQDVYAGPVGCEEGAAVCQQDSQGTVDTLGQVQTQQMYMHKDGETIVVQYSQGSNACSHSQRRSDRSAAMVKIYLRCNKKVYIGEPRRMKKSSSEDDSCVFEFEWETHLACKEQRLEVKENNGVVYDPRTNSPISVASLMKLPKKIPEDGYTYQLQLDGLSDTEGCQGASVCQTKPQTDFQAKNLGKYVSRKFYMQDDVLEMEVSSSTPCDGSQGGKTMSIIRFSCSEMEEEPFLEYKSKACHYVFSWSTPALCQDLDLDGEIPGKGGKNSGSHDDGGGHGQTVGIVLGVLSALIVATILVVVFRKKERRTALSVRVRTCFNRARSGKSYRYTTLVEGDRNSLLANSSGGYGTDVEDAGGLNPFGDDSDDDIIL